MAIHAVQIEHKLFSVDEYEQMISAGVLGEDDRLELIEGEIIKLSPIGSVHVFMVNRLTNLLAARVRERDCGMRATIRAMPCFDLQP